MSSIGLGTAGQALANMYANTTTTASGTANYPIGGGVYPGYAQPAYPVPTFPNDPVMAGGLVGVYRVRRLENGYLVESAPCAGGPVKEHYCETLKDVGERIAALGVQKALEGGQP